MPHPAVLSPAALILAALFTVPAFAQQTPPNPPIPPPSMMSPQQLARTARAFALPVPRAEPAGDLGILPPGTWWRYPETIKDLSLSPDQQHKMDDIFRQNRIQLIDLKASLEKEQLNLEPLLNANPPDTNKALSQISHIADLRAELEKANAKMLLGLRAQLTADQWTKLQTLHPGSSLSFDGANWLSKNSLNTNTSTVTTTCNKVANRAAKFCLITTVSTKDIGGHLQVTTCTQDPTQSAPKCRTTPAGLKDGSFNIFIPRDQLATPPPAMFELDLNPGDAAD